MSTITLIIFQIILAIIFHELGHFITALIFGHVIKFSFSCGYMFNMFIPRWTWVMPTNKRYEQRLIAQAGFALELLVIPFLSPIYAFIAILHFILYPWYSGNDSDFKYF